MKRNEFISELKLVAIDLAEGSIDMDKAQESLEDIAKEFCDHYEGLFNEIRDDLDDISEYVPLAEGAHKIADKASRDLY